MHPNKTGHLILQVASSLERQVDQALQESLSIGVSQYRVMTALQDRPGIQQRQVAEALVQTEASISRQVRIMTEQGLLTSRVSQANRRQHLTALTPHGLQVAKAANHIVSELYSAALSALSAQECTQLGNFLKRL